MNVHTNLTTHPKFLLFKRELGDPAALEYLLRLWGQCQLNMRGENWGKVSSEYLETTLGWFGEAGRLFAALSRPYCGKPGWIKISSQGGMTVTNWEEHNHTLVNNWRRNPTGMKKTALPTGTPTGTPTGRPRARRGLPAGEPHLIGVELSRVEVSGVPERAPVLPDGKPDGEGDGRHFAEAAIPSLAEVLAFCAGPAGIPEKTGRAFFHHYEKTAHPAWTDQAGKRFQWPGKLTAWHARDREKGGAQKPEGEKTREGLEALLEAETDPGRRAALKAELKKAAV